MPRKRRQNLNVAQLTRIIKDEQARHDLRLYYGVGLASRKLSPFSGGWFERLGNACSDLESCNRFTASDILAVQMLSIQIPSLTVLNLLEGQLAADISKILEQIPTSVRLWDDEAECLVKESGPASDAWHLLEEQDGIGWVIAGKLLARKRPSLIPVYDNIVRCAFDRPKNFWLALRNALVEDEGNFRAALEELIERAGIAEVPVTPLRALDVVLWMRHRRHHTGHGCGGLSDHVL